MTHAQTSSRNLDVLPASSTTPPPSLRPASPLRTLRIGGSITADERGSSLLARLARAVSAAGGGSMARDVSNVRAAVKTAQPLRSARALRAPRRCCPLCRTGCGRVTSTRFDDGVLRSAGCGPSGRSTFYLRGVAFTHQACAQPAASPCARARALRHADTLHVSRRAQRRVRRPLRDAEVLHRDLFWLRHQSGRSRVRTPGKKCDPPHAAVPSAALPTAIRGLHVYLQPLY